MNEANVVVKFMANAQGHLVPEANVRPIDIERDALVKRLTERFNQVRKVCAEFRAWADAEIDAYLELSQERFGVTHGGQHGNLTLMTYDGQLKVLRAIQNVITFSDEIHAAKHLIDECIKDWCAGARPELKTVVDDAFKVNKSGDLAADRILGLRRLEIADARWKAAMDAISASVQIQATRRYLRFYHRVGDGDYALDPAGV